MSPAWESQLRRLPRLPFALIEGLDRPDAWRRRGAWWVFDTLGRAPTGFGYSLGCTSTALEADGGGRRGNVT